MKQNGIEQNGIEWKTIEWNEMGNSRMECKKIEYNGTKWNKTKDQVARVRIKLHFTDTIKSWSLQKLEQKLKRGINLLI